VPSETVRVSVSRLRRLYRVLPRAAHGTFFSVLEHDCLNIAQSTAYSGIVTLFPALIVAAALINLLPDTAPLRFQMAAFFGRVLPPGVSPLFAIAFGNTPHTHTVRAMLSASIVSLLGASNVIATLMEGLRRAQDQRRDSWTFWERRLRSLKLVPLALAPLGLVSLLLVFGHTLASWFAPNLAPQFRPIFFAVTLIVRWVIALSASVGIIALLYHAGIPYDQPAGATSTRGRAFSSIDERVFLQVHQIRATLPGAFLATIMWFVTTLLFGWYVTRFANYSEVYGSLGAGIALLFWLYIISLSVLCGAEFNAQLDRVQAAELERSGETSQFPPSPPVQQAP
jgi:membrane protein